MALPAPAASTPRLDRCDSTDQRDSEDSTEPTESQEPIEKIDSAEPTLPIEAKDPTLPIDSTEPWDPMDRTLSCDHSDHRDDPGLGSQRGEGSVEAAAGDAGGRSDMGLGEAERLIPAAWQPLPALTNV